MTMVKWLKQGDLIVVFKPCNDIKCYNHLSGYECSWCSAKLIINSTKSFDMIGCLCVVHNFAIEKCRKKKIISKRKATYKLILKVKIRLIIYWVIFS